MTKILFVSYKLAKNYGEMLHEVFFFNSYFFTKRLLNNDHVLSAALTSPAC